MSKAILTITKAASDRIKHLLSLRENPALGIRVGVKKGGCSGLEYTIEYAEEKGKYDEIVEQDGIQVIIDPKAVMYLIGSEMDFVEEKMKSGFAFRNPNEKGTCGCGESFHV